MPHANVNGVDLYYEEHGTGTPLLLIMGFGGNATAWEPSVPFFSAQHRVITFDNRGAGRSGVPEPPYTMTQFADDALGLLDALGVERAHVYGVSMGGMIAQHVYLRQPRRLMSLVLGCTTPGGPHGVQAEERVVNALLTAGTLEPRAAMDLMLPINFSDAFIAANTEAIWQLVQQDAALRATPAGLKGHLTAVIGHDTYDRLPEIAIPTLVLHGDDDPLVPAANGRILAERIPRARLILYPGARHCYFLEVIPRSPNDVLAFLSQVPAAATAAGH